MLVSSTSALNDEIPFLLLEPMSDKVNVSVTLLVISKIVMRTVTKRLCCFFRYENLLQTAKFHTAVVTETREKYTLKELLVFIKNAESLIRERRTVKTPTSLLHPVTTTEPLVPSIRICPTNSDPFWLTRLTHWPLYHPAYILYKLSHQLIWSEPVSLTFSVTLSYPNLTRRNVYLLTSCLQPISKQLVYFISCYYMWQMHHLNFAWDLLFNSKLQANSQFITTNLIIK